jgi:hypothetical protein
MSSLIKMQPCTHKHQKERGKARLKHQKRILKKAPQTHYIYSSPLNHHETLILKNPTISSKKKTPTKQKKQIKHIIQGKEDISRGRESYRAQMMIQIGVNQSES